MKFSNIFKHYNFCINFGCFLVFCYFMVQLIRGYISPTALNTTVSKSSLADLAFPLVFKICLKPGYDISKLESYGYMNVYDYFNGTTGKEDVFVGWAGQNKSFKPSGETDIVNNRFGTRKQVWYKPAIRARRTCFGRILLDF